MADCETIDLLIRIRSLRSDILKKILVLFPLPKKCLCSILSFVFWIFPPLYTAVELESADSKQYAISKYLFSGYFAGDRYILWAMRKTHHTSWKKALFIKKLEPTGSISIYNPFWRVLYQSIILLGGYSRVGSICAATVCLFSGQNYTNFESWISKW